MDSSGEQHLQIDHNIYKRRLDLEGRPIEEPKKEDITIPTKANEVCNALVTNYSAKRGNNFILLLFESHCVEIVNEA